MRDDLIRIILGVFLAACGGPTATGGDGDGVGNDDPGGSGGGGAGDDDPGGGDEGEDDPLLPPGVCLGPTVIATIDAPEGYIEDQEEGTPGQKERYLIGTLSTDVKPDEFYLGLWDGYGVFAAGAAMPGTYTIAGEDTSDEDCGLCVQIFADVDETTEEPAQVYTAESGMVTLESVDGNLKGSLSSVVLVSGTCRAEIASWTFDVPLVIPEPETP